VHKKELGIISAQTLGLVKGPEPAAEGCTNSCMSEVVENHRNVCLGPVLEGGYASRSTVDKCVQVVEHTASDVLQGKGVQAGRQTSMVVQMGMLLGPLSILPCMGFC
jgi:hypothetical protein